MNMNCEGLSDKESEGFQEPDESVGHENLLDSGENLTTRKEVHNENKIEACTSKDSVVREVIESKDSEDIIMAESKNKDVGIKSNVEPEGSTEASKSQDQGDTAIMERLDVNLEERNESESLETGDVIKEAAKFRKLKSKVKERNYRAKNCSTVDPGENSNDAINEDSTADAGQNRDRASTVDRDPTALSNDESNSTPGREGLTGRAIVDEVDSNVDGSSHFGEERADDNSSDWTTASDDDDDDEDNVEEEDDKVIPAVLLKEKPKAKWFIIPEVLNREVGNNPLFRRRFYGSLHSVERLELMYKLESHDGCVNTLNFNRKGNLLASASDDLNVVIWDWATGKKKHSFVSGHKDNVFQAKWLPLNFENYMVTGARDGKVRLYDFGSNSSREIGTHSGPLNKLAIHPDTPHVILTAGEDSKVLSIDIRQSRPVRLLNVKEEAYGVPLHSINSNPLNSNEFCLGGRDPVVRIYDKRKVSTPLHRLCAAHLKDSDTRAHVTAAVYNYNGSEIVASYNDEDVYLFDTLIPHPQGDCAHRYQGHRNSATLKGVNFFGAKSEFVISGSDCGNIFIWDKNTEAIVQWMAGDEQGVVNCLEPHPHIPVLATSGLDCDVKIWVPSCDQAPTMTKLETIVRSNLNMRNRAQKVTESNLFDGHMLWILWRHVRQTERQQNRHLYGAREDESSDNSSSHSEEDSDDRQRCSPS